MDSAQTLLLNQGFEPIKVISWQRAISLLFLGKVEVLEEYDDRVVDNHTHHQHEREHRHAIEREVERAHHSKRRDDRTRNRDRGD